MSDRGRHTPGTGRVRQGYPEPAMGTASALGAFALWGVLPLYWKAIGHLGSAVVVGHRVLWSLPVLFLLLGGTGKLPVVRAAMGDRGVVLRHLASSLLLGANWFLFIFATLTDRVLEAALGYFLNPLFNVALGWFLLGEKRGIRQMVALGLAAAGVLVQALAVQGFPWIALALAVTFSLYALARKKSPLDSLEGLAVETTLMAPLAVMLLALAPASGREWTAGDWGMVAGAGVVTTLPLLLFAAAARRIGLAALGMLQFLAPTLHFLIGCFLFKEPLTAMRLGSFVLIWIGVAVFLGTGRAKRAPIDSGPGVAT